jgi:endoribonuclease LACTB2
VLRPRDIAPGVALFPVRTPTLPPATHTNTYALLGDEVYFVEPATPYEDERAAWIAWARGIGRVAGVIVTHHHVDHGSASGHFARALSVPLLGHRETFARLHDLDGVTLRALDEGDVVAGWTVLHTPGHAPGHVCLFKDRTLIAGDMVANGSTILIPPDDGGDMAEYIAQLRRLDALNATLVLPAHGEPIDDPHALFSHYIKHRLMREEKVLNAYEKQRQSLQREPTLAEIVPIAYDDTPVHLWPIARSAAEAHLIKLRNEKRI